MSILAIIPARGGSVRLKRKNIKHLAGKPLIAYSIEAAKNSSNIDRVVVSTDDDEFAEVSRKYGAEVIMRPTELATSEASSLSVMKHVLENLDDKPDVVVLLQPTSPLRTTEHIDLALGLLLDNDADAVISVKKVPDPVALVSVENGYLMFGGGSTKLPKNSGKDFYQINGAVYVFNREVVESAESYAFGEKTLPYVMDQITSLDIDTLEDFELAEAFLEYKPKREGRD
jgi:CMP-N,N'-diacetyllegionaminic acid synthase